MGITLFGRRRHFLRSRSLQAKEMSQINFQPVSLIDETHEIPSCLSHKFKVLLKVWSRVCEAAIVHHLMPVKVYPLQRFAVVGIIPERRVVLRWFAESIFSGKDSFSRALSLESINSFRIASMVLAFTD